MNRVQLRIALIALAIVRPGASQAEVITIEHERVAWRIVQQGADAIRSALHDTSEPMVARLVLRDLCFLPDQGASCADICLDLLRENSPLAVCAADALASARWLLPPAVHIRFADIAEAFERQAARVRGKGELRAFRLARNAMMETLLLRNLVARSDSALRRTFRGREVMLAIALDPAREPRVVAELLADAYEAGRGATPRAAEAAETPTQVASVLTYVTAQRADLQELRESQWYVRAMARGHADPDERLRAIRALLPTTANAELLADLAATGPDEIALAAVEALGSFGALARPVTNVLWHVARYGTAELREAAGVALDAVW
ncbi:MAG: hypothetical protein IPM29_09020 [Planctomycetes bacterium]|nr:hypothetical protein [Planctomycetota bacterium]